MLAEIRPGLAEVQVEKLYVATMSLGEGVLNAADLEATLFKLGMATRAEALRATPPSTVDVAAAEMGLVEAAKTWTDAVIAQPGEAVEVEPEEGAEMVDAAPTESDALEQPGLSVTGLAANPGELDAPYRLQPRPPPTSRSANGAAPSPPSSAKPNKNPRASKQRERQFRDRGDREPLRDAKNWVG